MPETEIPPALRVDIYLVFESSYANKIYKIRTTHDKCAVYEALKIKKLILLVGPIGFLILQKATWLPSTFLHRLDQPR